MDRKEFYGDLKAGETFILLRNGKRCVKTERGAVYLEDGYYYNIGDKSRVRLLDVELHIL